jgi:hypothetical protein
MVYFSLLAMASAVVMNAVSPAATLWKARALVANDFLHGPADRTRSNACERMLNAGFAMQLVHPETAHREGKPRII